MLSNQKYRVNTLAKDLELKSKDIVDMLNEKGIEGKAHMAVIEPDEFGVIMNAVTSEAQFTNLNDYVDGKVMPKGLKIKPQEVAQPQPAVKAEAPQPQEVKEVKPVNEVKPEPKVQHQPRPQQQRQNQEQRPAQQKTQYEHKPQQRQNQEQRSAQQRPVQQKQHTDQRPVQKQQQQAGQRPQPEQKQPVKQAINRPQAADNKFKKPVPQAVKPKPQQKQRQESKPQNTLEYKPKHQETDTIIEVKEDTNRTRISGAKFVDTRGGTNVDLSKYDEKLENIAQVDTDRKVTSTPDRQKLKKQNNRDPRQDNKRKESERIAMEKIKKLEAEKAKKQQLSITIPDEISVGEFASRLKVTAAEIIKRLMLLGVMANVNQIIDYDTAYLIADELGAKATKEVVITIEDKLFDEVAEKESDLVERAPVVVVMGHVDHGKTTLLDSIKDSNVTAGEAGGITQHIGASRVSINGKEITFLDTPGHEAFTAMRARGAQATDIAVLVVAADDGIMPQTIEAINHARAAGVDIIVAINKMDLFTANPDTIKQTLTNYELIPEEWGGDVICVPVSAKTKMGIEDLLENILLVAEMKELKANPNKRAKGIVIEARLDKGRGPVATVLVQNGTLKSGDVVIAGTAVGHVRAMTDYKGKVLKTAGPSVPVEIIGLSEVPLAGDEFNAVEDERMARELAAQRRQKIKDEVFKANANVSLDDLFARISEGTQDLNIILKADVGGSAEAVKTSLEKLSNEEIRVKVIHTGVGGITEGDVMLATASNALIIGFNVRPDKNALDSAERQKVDVRTYRIIYECIEEVSAAIKGMLAPEFKEVILGHVEVRQTIHVPNVGTIAGSYVQDGKISRNSQIRVLRDGVVIYEDKISSLKRFKDDVREVAQGYECGVGLDRFNDIKNGDIFEVYEMEEIAR